MKKIFFVPLLAVMLWACEKEKKSPEPHLELGQKIQFLGSHPELSYIIIGYRHELEGKTYKAWDNHAYIVFLYINDSNDVKQAVIHRNSILKQ